MKILQHPVTQEVAVVSEAEAEKLFKSGWKFTSRYELKRQAAIAKAKPQKTQAA